MKGHVAHGRAPEDQNDLYHPYPQIDSVPPISPSLTLPNLV